MSHVTHFEIFAEEPAKLADFYRNLLGWKVEQAPAQCDLERQLRRKALEFKNQK